MALHKLVMKRGSYFKGYQLSVSATTGDYVLHIDRTDKEWYVNSINIIPDDSGAGDYTTIAHYEDTGTGDLVRTLADTIYNLGPRYGYTVALPAIEPFEANEDLRITYTNAGGVAVEVTAIVEFIR